ncbi:lytic transglycosylase [Rubrivivax gelatinosus]|uniref:Lytic transglycosylase n=1 Tax=Rubrivivax gelatinosus TaxID=28068 RepID=A0ABS1DRG6_RUBGE|nr:lytic transglycosylase domain-containing protein [Rubrivivax gelatinosus]MBK1611913.1 lytic transglycosylase [Rubrivivax gelatinosus]MBK1711570.1 lytic transglycosylase [Rubrivivax gelatinosus]MBZ8143247.1 lytic transglycosylase [Rubrivivax gelatinosus]
MPLDPAALTSLVVACAPQVHPSTALLLIDTESGANPYAIGVVGGRLERQPRHRTEALATVAMLERDGWNYSLGLAQINRANFARLNLDPAAAFDACRNLQAMQQVLGECFDRAGLPGQRSLQRALSCYYAGDFSTGISHGYVARVVDAARTMRLMKPP